MKHIKKLLAIFLTILTMLSVCSVATSVFAAEYVEQNVRNEYFDDALSDYLKNIIDIDNAVAIKEKEDAEKIEEESSKSIPFSMYSAKSASVASVEDSDEIKDETDHTRLTLELKNGTNAAYLFSEPISYTDKNGKLIYKDTNIEEVTDEDLLKNGYTYENGNNDYRIYFSSNSSKGIKLVSRTGIEIKFVPNGNADLIGYINQIKNDGAEVDTFEYPEAYGVDTKLNFYPQLNGVKEEITLSKYHGISEFGFTLYTGKYIAAVNSRGEVEIINPETKTIVETFAAPFAYDALGCEDPASEHYTDCSYVLDEINSGEYSLKIKVPTEYLESENTVYPVTIDPTTSNISMTYDTAIYSAKSTQPQSSNANACFGKTATSQYGKGRALFKFNIPGDIANYAKITSAKLWLRETTGRTETMYVRPYVVKDSWDNSVTWETKPSYYNGTADYPGNTNYQLPRRNINSTSTDNSSSPYWYAFDIAYAVRSWTTGTANKGLIFISENEASDADYFWRAFATKEHSTSAYRPYAVISYTNDTTKPTISSVSGNPTSWTNSNVTLTVTATDNVYGAAGVKEYSFDNGSTWQSSNSKSFSSNQTVKIKAKDYAGNISDTFTVVISKIDKTKPTATIALSPTSFTNGNVTATITLSDNAALESYKIGSDSAVTISGTSKTVTKTYSADATVSVTVTDAAGNSTTVSKNFTNIDKIKPVITGVSGNPTSWTKNDVTLTVTATDEESGIDKYSFDNGSTWQDSKSHSFTSNQTVNIKVKDKAGNPSNTFTVIISKIDKTVPTATASCEATSAGSRITVTASDSQSGLNSTAYSYNGGSWTSNNYYNTTNTSAVSIKVRDALGNEKSLSYTPSATSPVTVITSPEEWTNENVIITVNGTKLSKYKFNNGAWQTSKTFSVSANGSVSISVEDKFGIQKTLSAVQVGNIDKAAPVISDVTQSSIDWSSSPATITVTAHDVAATQVNGMSDIGGYSFDGGVSWQSENACEFSENDEVTIAVKDNAGNITYYPETIVIDKIDNTAPTTPYIYEENGTVYLTDTHFDFDENVESSEHLEYKIGENGTWTTYTEPLEIVNTYDVTVYARSVDEAGNVSVSASTVVECTFGEYTVSFDDIALGDGVLPVGFTRTYSGNNGWFFSFNANIAQYCENGYVFTDFDGDKNYYFKNAEDKFVNDYDEELLLNTLDYAFELPYGNLTLCFGADGKLAAVKNGETVTSYAWTASTLTIGSIAEVSFNESGMPTSITLTKEKDGVTYTKSVSYSYTNGDLTAFTDAISQVHTYGYTDSKLTYNDGESITYVGNRVQTISQPNGAFVKYEYDDDARNPDFETNVNVGKVIVSDSKGVTDNRYYSDGFTVSNSVSGYSDKAVYDVNNISNVVVSNDITDIAYVVEYPDEETQGESQGEESNEENADETEDSDENTNEAEEETTQENEVSITYQYDVWGNVIGATENDEVKFTAEYDALGRLVSQTADGETISYTYDSKGNILTVTDSEGTTTYTYDNGNLTGRINPDNTAASYVYDNYGNLTNHCYNGYSFTYNTLGSIMIANTGEQNIATYIYSNDTKQNVLNASFGNGQSVTYEYNTDNELTNIKLGENVKYSYTYDEDNDGNVTTTVNDNVNNLIKILEESKLTVKTANDVVLYSVENHFKDDEVEGSFDGVTTTIGETAYTLVCDESSDTFKIGDDVDFTKTYLYNDDNELTSISFGGATTNYGYTADGNLNNLAILLNGITKTYSYGFDNKGNVTAEMATNEATGELGETQVTTSATHYTYDSKNQIVTAQNGNAEWSYVYDNRGNIVSKSVSENGTTATDTYVYDNVWQDKLISYNNQSITYDLIGNPTSYLGTEMTWTMGRQLASFGSNTYTYDENGIRTSKTVNGVKTEYYLNGTDIIYQTDGTTSIRFIYDRNSELIGFNYNNAIYFYVKNALGVINDIVDNSGNVVASYSYDPYGKVLSVTGNTVIGNLNPFRYKSYYYDSDTGFYYLQSRYYDPDTGRFINCDDVNYIGITESEVSYNPFAYCENEPINNIDPMGQSIILATAIGFGIGVLVSGCAKLYQNYRSGNKWYTGLAISMLAGGIGGAISCVSIPGVSSWVCASVFGAAGNLVTKVILGEIKSIKDLSSAILQGAAAGLLGNAAAKCLNKIVATNFAKWSKSAQKSFLSKIGRITNRTLRDIRQMIKNTGSTKVIEKSIFKIIDKYGYPALVSAFVSSVGTSV